MTLAKLVPGQVWLCLRQSNRVIITKPIPGDDCIEGAGYRTTSDGTLDGPIAHWRVRPELMRTPAGLPCYPLADRNTANEWVLTQLIYDPNP